MRINDPGKYDAACTAAREATKAEGVALIVFNGEHGGGFSVQAPPDILLALPRTLEFMAKAIRRR